MVLATTSSHRHCLFPGDRDAIRFEAAIAAMALLRACLDEG